jgi:predicted nicotinamide N-methyase
MLKNQNHLESNDLMNNFDDLTTNFLSDENLQLITGQIFVGHGVLVAHQLGLFKTISNQSLSLSEIALRMNLEERAVQALISCSSALNLVECKNDGYGLSSTGKMYLDEESPEFYGKVLDLLIQENEIMTFPNIKKAILSNKSLVNNGDLFAIEESVSNTSEFIASLHYKALKPAFYWNKLVNLKESTRFVDLGAGSGVHTIAACLNNPQLQGVICDRKTVIQHSEKYVKNFDLESRIELFALDIWKDSYPPGDVYFLGDIFHDWNREQCLFLAKKCFQSLPKNGRIILHEMLFNDDKTGPFLTAGYNMKMMVWTEGQQFSHVEIQEILEEAGFEKISIEQSLGNWSIIVGEKL